ncbi:MAG: helix-turn-helix transcriptional regulator [Gemmatimonadota bacterium]|nr:helix-turn-helix transcriptional regulator [Gemmatimonadota bacterium]
MSDDPAVPLNPRDLMILAVLAEQPQHGYGIIKAVEARSRSGVQLDPANLYRSLRRMSGDGWVEEVEADNDDRRRTFALTPSGRGVLATELRRLEALLAEARPLLAEGPDA